MYPVHIQYNDTTQLTEIAITLSMRNLNRRHCVGELFVSLTT